MNNDKDISEIIKLEKKIKNSEIKVNKDNFIKELNKKIIFLKNKYFKIEFKNIKKKLKNQKMLCYFLTKK